MVNGRIPSVFSKTYVTPRRPYEKARLDQELKTIGEYGLRNKREVWRVKYTLAKIRKAARELLTLEEKDDKRLFQGKQPQHSSARNAFRSCSSPNEQFDDQYTELTPLVGRVCGDNNLTFFLSEQSISVIVSSRNETIL